jgi:poly-gamma-glutamate synthesis protein (capsule biosynthesis protein)
VAETLTLALAGDTMLGRGVADRLVAGAHPEQFVASDVADLLRSADLTLVNLECCISDRGTPWPAPGKPFFFRAPPRAVDVLRWLGIDAVTVANNHALDFGVDALLDTGRYLEGAGIAMVGAGIDVEAARRPFVLEAGGLRVGIIGVTDHPADFAAGPRQPGVAYADLDAGTPQWLLDVVAETRTRCDVLVVTPHWGPNMVAEPRPAVRAAAAAITDAGATLIAGHSAHVFHGVAGRVLFDLGDFLDDYADDARLRNDLGLVWRVMLGRDGPVRLEAIPIALEFCYTRLAVDDEFAWIERRLARACADLHGPPITRENDRLVVHWS